MKQCFETSQNTTSYTYLPPFTAGVFESHVNMHGCSLPIRFFRSYDTGLPETMFSALEGMVAQGGMENVRYKRQSTYSIWVTDTDTDIEYKLICVPNPDNSGIILTEGYVALTQACSRQHHSGLQPAFWLIAPPSSTGCSNT
ncbi:unnamed protein product [Closterium sp. NIES-53]